MLCADSLEDVAVWLDVKAAQWISAQSVKIVSLGYFVPEVFDSNRRLCIALRPEQRCTQATTQGRSPFTAYAAAVTVLPTAFWNRTGSG